MATAVEERGEAMEGELRQAQKARAAPHITRLRRMVSVMC